MIPAAYHVFIFSKLIFLDITKKEYCNIAERMEESPNAHRNSTAPVGLKQVLVVTLRTNPERSPTPPIIQDCCKSLLNKSEPCVEPVICGL